MKEFEFDNITLMGGWFMPKNICGDLVKFMKNQPLQDGMMYTEKGGQQVVPDMKESKEVAVDYNNEDEPFHTYKIHLNKVIENYVEKYPYMGENTEVALPLRNIISMVAAASIATWAYFGLVERLNQLETNQTMMKSDLDMNTEFRIKWPRGEMGSLPADAEQFMLIEHITSELEKLSEDIENGKAPYDQQQKLTLEFYEKRISNIEENLEKIRNNGYKE